MPGWIGQAEELLKTLNLLSIAVRILLAMLCGGIIGIEREKANQAAGNADLYAGVYGRRGGYAHGTVYV